MKSVALLGLVCAGAVVAACGSTDVTCSDKGEWCGPASDSGTGGSGGGSAAKVSSELEFLMEAPI